MLRYVLKRILLLIPVLLGVSFIVFSIMSLTPGDPASVILGPMATKEDIQKLNEELGYYRPFLVRYFSFITGALRGDFGKSYRSGNPVFGEIFSRFPTTLKLAIGSILFAIIVGTPIGIISAVRQYSWFDMTGTIIAMFMAAVPQFWLGLLLMFLLSVRLQLLPTSGYGDGSLTHLLLPALTLGVGYMALLARTTRAAVMEILTADYVRTAAAKGLSRLVINGKHVFRNALILVLTTAGLQFGSLIGQTVIVEKLFSWPGIGRYLVERIELRDYTAVQSTIGVFAMFVAGISLIMDILYAFIDPRIRY